MAEHSLATRIKNPVEDISNLPPIQCGEDARQHFSFGDGYTNLNHGSFGTYPTCIRNVLHHYQDAAEARPDKFIRYEYPLLLDESREALARLLKIEATEVVLLSNATLGINTVLRALEYEADDVIIYFSTIYGACEKTVEYITETTLAHSRRLPYVYPISDEALCEQFIEAVKGIKAEGKRPKLAIFDTIVSMPGVRVPFERLTKICKQNDILSCIDAAHSIGQIELDLKELQPDFYVSNCHKWLHVPRGCAVFYVPLRNQHLIRSTLPTSHGFVPRPRTDGTVVDNPLPTSTKSTFINNFEFVGTLDNSPYLCIPAALAWRKKLHWKDLEGEAAIYAYIQHIAKAGAAITSSKLKTEVMDNRENTLTRCSMSNVRLPLSLEELAQGDMTKAIEIAQWVARNIVNEYNTFMAIFIHNKAFWVRLSGQVYLTEKDFEFGAKCLEEVCERVRNREWQKS